MLNEKINLDDPALRAQLEKMLPAQLPAAMRHQIMQVLHQQLRVGNARETSIIDVMNSVIEGLGLSEVLRQAAPEGVAQLLNVVDGVQTGNAADVIKQVQEGVRSGQISFKTKPIKNTGEHVGRNDPCPCGSGKKRKRCCGMKS